MIPPFLRALAFGVALLPPGLAFAGEAEPAPVPAVAAPVVPVASAPAASVSPGAAAATKPAAASLSETQQYCQNIAAAAADARFAWQRKQLNDLQAQLKQRIADLDDKAAEFRALVAKRDELMRKANDTVLGLYAHMKPEAAAGQLAALDDDVAAAILAQLNQRQASTILNDIPPDKAARLVAMIAATVPREKKS